MSKFKVGDEVVRTGPSIESEGMINGVKYTISHCRSGVLYFVGMTWGYDAEQFEMAETIGTSPVEDPGDSPVEHPKHYNSHPSGVECITVARHHNFNIGNVLKYLWRIGLKGSNAATKEQRLQEIDKAIFYLQDERARIEAE